MRVQSLGHVVLKVRDLDRSVPFYAGVLGLTEVARNERGMVFFSIDGNHHDIALIEMGDDAPAAPQDSPGLAHVALKVGDDLDALRDAKAVLDANGVELVRIADHIVSKSLYFQDPDGNELELFVDGDPQTWRDNPGIVATRLPLEL